ncbi:hypothetical protein EJ08DRAFT_593143 [Tothia fuscella]|uniref:Uncharacterized protein n=1 Tax=Tothia fuscella TaxID=1048955 RepID=A0A9P4NLW8_9PEZI|nr:hypothetical protein EJ08DRAFT_593143 [Tothia fuscella]
MRREHSIASTVFHHLFSAPTATDPPDFATHLAKHLVAEVRIETQRFYGGLETVEARYPGLNYSHSPHRKRLGRFPHHARLFRAFDDLGLTENEIGMLCRWEGTLWARQRYERDEGIKVVDTTCAEIGPWVDRRIRKRSRRSSPRGIKVKTDIEMRDAHTPESEVTEDSTDSEEPESMVVALNQRLMAAAAAREHHGLPHDIIMDPAWEQYLKEQAERGEGGSFVGDTSSVLRAAALAQAMESGISSTVSQSNSVQPQAPATMVEQ